jgi:hypothetical protein
MSVHYLGDNGPDGVVMGTGTSEKIGFHGATPIVQATVTAVATGATAATIVTTLQALQAALENLGLIADS